MLMNYVESGVPVAPAAVFVGDFLRDRDAVDDFVLVEFGHGESPIAFIQPRPFLGGRAAIGIETWFHDQHGTRRDMAMDARDEDGLDQNVFFIDHDPGGNITYEKLGKVCLYEGGYDTTTILPDGAAEETVASNVFGYEQLADHPDRTTRLLVEMSRVTAAGGFVVIRETITPLHNQSLDETLFERAGLTLTARVTPEDAEAWQKLEEVYDAERAHNGFSPDGFYLFLQKAETP